MQYTGLNFLRSLFLSTFCCFFFLYVSHEIDSICLYFDMHLLRFNLLVTHISSFIYTNALPTLDTHFRCITENNSITSIWIPKVEYNARFCFVYSLENVIVIARSQYQVLIFVFFLRLVHA